MNNKITLGILAVVLIGISFYGGMTYAKSSQPPRGNFAAFAGGSGRMMRSGMGNGILNGDIVAKDATSITLQMRDGSSKIVFLSDSTNILKAVSGKLSDLNIGEQVTTIGTPNSDGSITAQSIQIRPATTTMVSR